MRLQRIELAGDLLDGAGEVRLIGVLGDHPQCLLLSRTADHDRDARDRCRNVHRVGHLIVLAPQRNRLAPQHRHDDLQRFLQLLEPVGEGTELVTERLVLELEPARADAERRSTAGDVVECGDRLRQQRRVPVGVAGDQGREPHRLGVLGQRRQHRVALEHRLIVGADARQLVEVVHHEHPVETGRLGRLGLSDDIAEDVGVGDAGVGEIGDLIAEPGHGKELL